MTDQKTEQKPDHEKRIREALEADEYLTTNVAKADLRALLADLDRLRDNLDAMRGALKQCHSTLTDERLGLWHYMEGSQIYSDFKQAADRADAALKGASHE